MWPITRQLAGNLSLFRTTFRVRHFSSNVLIPKRRRLENIFKSRICKHIARLGHFSAKIKQLFHYYIIPSPQRPWCQNLTKIVDWKPMLGNCSENFITRHNLQSSKLNYRTAIGTDSLREQRRTIGLNSALNRASPKLASTHVFSRASLHNHSWPLPQISYKSDPSHRTPITNHNMRTHKFTNGIHLNPLKP
jgi:hypothetical protein